MSNLSEDPASKGCLGIFALISGFFGLFATVAVILDIVGVAAIVGIVWWIFNHAIAPSFGWPTINIY